MQKTPAAGSSIGPRPTHGLEASETQHAILWVSSVVNVVDMVCTSTLLKVLFSGMCSALPLTPDLVSRPNSVTWPLATEPADVEAGDARPVTESGGFDLDSSSLGFLPLGQRDGQHTVLEFGRDLVAVYVLRQLTHPREAAVASLLTLLAVVTVVLKQWLERQGRTARLGRGAREGSGA